MTFQEILPEFLKGAKIRKTSWTKQYVFINNKNVIVDENNNVCHLQGHNLVEDGWEIYDDREYFDFCKALELMEDGQKVRSKAWGNIITGCLYLEGNEFCMECGNKDKKWHYYYNLKRRDLKAKDWYVVED